MIPMNDDVKIDILNSIETMCVSLYDRVKSGMEYDAVNVTDSILLLYVKIRDEYPDVEDDMASMVLGYLINITNLLFSRESDELYTKINYVINFIEGIG